LARCIVDGRRVRFAFFPGTGDALKALNGKVVAIREDKPKRSTQANRRYWALLTVAARSLGYDVVEELHEAVAWKLLRIDDDPITGTPRRKRTPKLNSSEFKDYTDAVERVLLEYGADLTGWDDEMDRMENAA